MSIHVRPVTAPLAKTFALALLSCAALAACAPADPEAPVPDAQAPAQDPPPVLAPTAAEDPAEPAPPGTGETTGGDGSQISLDGLAEADVGGADLAGELACSFSSEAGAQPLLLAKGDVASKEPAQGMVKVAGYVEQVRAPGGFDGMLDNPTFTGQGKTIRIEQTGDAIGDAIGGGGSPPRPATLTYLRADGASRSFEGQWQCGP